MLDQWKRFLREDLENDTWFTDGNTEAAGRSLAECPGGIRRTPRTVRCPFWIRGIAALTLMTFGVTSTPAKMIARAADQTLTGDRTASQLAAVMDYDNRLTIDGDVTLTMDQDLTIRSLVINGGKTLTVTGDKKLWLDDNSTGVITGNRLIVDGATVDASTSCTDLVTSIRLTDLELRNHAEVRTSRLAEYVYGYQFNHLVILDRPVHGDRVSVTSPDGVVTQSMDNGKYVYLANGDPVSSITFRAGSAGGTDGSDGAAGTGPGVHVHHYVRKTILEPTETEDGLEASVCECGSMKDLTPLTGLTDFVENAVKTIGQTPENGVAEIRTNRWISFNRAVRDAMIRRPDVTIRVSFLEGGYKGRPLTFTIPAGTDAASLFDGNGYMGFLCAGGRFGYDG